MTAEVSSTAPATKRRRSFALGLVALVLALVPAILFIVLLSTGSTTDTAYNLTVDLTVFGVPAAIVLGAVIAVIAIVLNAGRILGIVTLVLLIPQGVFVAFAIYAIFLQDRGGA
ncbi:MAG: hypothetical protein JWN80_2770 [Microbacteriaceae bacterium]|nr:hypothetical protein [Microbacteriaceae bacterium]